MGKRIPTAAPSDTSMEYLAKQIDDALEDVATVSVRFSPDASGTTAGRSAHDAKTKGFTYHDSDTDLMYIKLSDTSADWSDAIPFGFASLAQTEELKITDSGTGAGRLSATAVNTVFDVSTDGSTWNLAFAAKRASGAVGFGTYDATHPVHVNGGVRMGKQDTSTVTLEMGLGAGGNRAVEIKMEGDTTYAPGFHIKRGATGANAETTIDHYGTGAFKIRGITSGNRISLHPGGAETFRALSGGPICIGHYAAPTGMTNGLVLINGADPSAGVVDGSYLFAKDVSGSSELFGGDEAGNETQLTSHSHELAVPAPDDPFPFTHYSKNRHIGLETQADLSKALRLLETMTGEALVHHRSVPAAEWEKTADMAAESAREALIEEKMGEIVAVDPKDAVERITGPSLPDRELYEFNNETGQVDKILISRKLEPRRVVEMMEDEETGDIVADVKFVLPEFRLKDGVVLDESTGEYWRQKTREEAESEVAPIAPKPKPKWIFDREKRSADDIRDEKVRTIKREARRRIHLIATPEKQANLMAEATEILEMVVSGELPQDRKQWPQETRDTVKLAREVKAAIKAIRERSNEIEQMKPLPDDLEDDRLWA